MSVHKIVPRWGQPMTGIIASIVFTLIAFGTWFLFADPRGPMHLYENPFLTFLAWMILVGVFQHIIFGDWPFHNLKQLPRMLVMTVANLVITWFVIYVVFEKFLGPIMMPLFDANAMAELNKMEYKEAFEKFTGPALTLMVVVGFFTYAFITILFKKWPFTALASDKFAAGLAEWSTATVVTVIVYGIFVFPFFMMALKQPIGGLVWWKGIAGTTHINWWIGWFEWCVVYLFMTANIWSGKPWNIIKKQPWSGLFGVVGIFVLAYSTMEVCLALQASFWGPLSAIADPKAQVAALNFRYYHAASIAGFTLFPFLAWNHYFDNWPQKGNQWVGFAIRTVGVFLIAIILYVVYYYLSDMLFGIPSVVGSQNWSSLKLNGEPMPNKPLVWLFWWIIPLLFNEWFGHKYLFYVEEHVDSNVKTNEALNI